MTNEIKIPQQAKIKVYWDDKPENYSRQARLKVRNYFSDKYGVDKANINVIYRPIKIGADGEVIEISGAGVDNILDRNYQVELMKKWCERNGKDVNFERLLQLDKKVNGSLGNQDDIKTHRSWSLKWLYIDNFLSFGNDNTLTLGDLNGLVVVNSEPSNQGGKTVLTVDAIKFLLFGKTTKTNTNDQVFNKFTDKDSLTVRGLLEVENEQRIIERVMTRRSKRSGGWNVTNKVNYYKILPDGEEVLLDEEDASKTTKLIESNVGSEKDFDITILTTARNLEDLIDAKATESGRLLTKFIGLEIIEEKEAIAKQFYSDFNKKKKGNHYDIVTLTSDNEKLKENVVIYGDNLKVHKETLVNIENKITRLEAERERLLNSKFKVDAEISQLNPKSLEQDLGRIKEKGIGFKEQIEELEKEIKKIKDVSYDEYKYNELEKEDRELTIAIGSLENKIISIGKTIANLKDSEICQTCKRALDDVDYSEEIEAYETEIFELQKAIKSKQAKLSKIKVSMDEIKENKAIVDKRDRLELERDKSEVEIGSLRNKMMSKKNDLKKYKDNKDAINKNIEIDADISSVKTDLVVEHNNKTITTKNIFSTEESIKAANEQLTVNRNMIKTLKKEEEVEKIYKVYLEIIGKKGISKLVLRSVLPIINSELQRLLDDICDFEVELIMTNKNEVEYRIIKNDVTNLLKSGSGLERTLSSLAIRCVLGKISHLPKPNFVTFDEVLGKVSAENIEKAKGMFDKIKEMFDIVFFISHNDLVKDWSDKNITVIKDNDISRLKVIK